MKLKSIVISISAVILVASAFGQLAPGGRPGGPGGARMGGPGGNRGSRMMDMDVPILKSLNLTATQQKKVAALKAATKVKLEKAMKQFMPAGGPPKPGTPPAEGARPDFTKMRAAMKPIRDGYEAGIKGILSKDQFTKYDAEVKAAREKMRAQFGGGRGGPGAGPKGAPGGGR